MKQVVIRDLKIGQGKPKICVPIVGTTKEEILQEARLIKDGEERPDLIEYRADWYASLLDVDKTIEMLSLLRAELSEYPLLFTIRTAKEGGEQELSFAQYEELLLAAAGSGCVDAVDVEAFSFGEAARGLIKSLKEKPAAIIGSSHDFEKTPDRAEIIRRLTVMEEMGADIAKIAVMPQNTEDLLTLLSATLEVSGREDMCPVITMSMSGMGALSRMAGEIFGSAVTFACVGKASAPGQMEIGRLKTVLEAIHESR